MFNPKPITSKAEHDKVKNGVKKWVWKPYISPNNKPP